MNNVNLNLLKYFYEVVNTKNITKASNNLLVSQPAITKAIKTLESELGTKLLERGKNGVYPTSTGEVLYKHIGEMYKDLNATLNIIETIKENGGNLYIGATTTNFLVLIEEALKKFRQLHPNVHIDIVLEEINILEERAKLGKMDIIIKNDYENIEGFSNIKSFDITDCFVASKKMFSELNDKKLSLNELLKYPFVLLSTNTHGRKNFDSFLRSKNIKFTPTYEFNSYSLCRELIKNGFGIGIGNPIHYCDSNDFIIVSTDFELPKRTFDIGYVRASKNSLISDFIQFIEK